MKFELICNINIFILLCILMIYSFYKYNDVYTIYFYLNT